MIHLIIEETKNKVRHEYWQDLRDKTPYYACYEYREKKEHKNVSKTEKEKDKNNGHDSTKHD